MSYSRSISLVLVTSFIVCLWGCKKVEHEEKVTCTFNVSAPEYVGVSKAVSTFGDGCYAPKDLTAVVLDASGTSEITRFEFPELFAKDQTEASIELNLVRGKTYVVAFWAQYKDADAFDISNITAVKVNYDNAVCSDEKRDAFCGACEVFVEGAFEEHVTLVRPFAQLNFATNDLSRALTAGLVEYMAKLTVSGVNDTYNVVTSEASGNVEATFKYSYFPGLTGNEDVSEIVDAVDDIRLYNVADGNHKWTGEELQNAESSLYDLLATNYILIGDADNTINQVVLSLAATSDADKPVLSVPVSDVPCHANWRTNIFGNLLTGELECKVQILQAYLNDIEATN